MQKSLILLTLLVGALLFQAIAQPVQFKVPITIKCSSRVDTLRLGVNGDGPGGTILDNTYALDADTLYGSKAQWSEMYYPPDFPKLRFSSKFIDIPGHSEMGETGMKPNDFRGFTSTNQIDTFAIRVFGENVAKNGATLSWPKKLNLFGHAWQLLKKQGETYKVIVKNMISTTSYTDPNKSKAKQLDYLLIKSGVVTGAKP
jgi:hypothetical protein